MGVRGLHSGVSDVFHLLTWFSYRSLNLEGTLRLYKLFRNSQKAWERNLDFYKSRTDQSSSRWYLVLKGRDTLVRLPILAFLVCGQRRGQEGESRLPEYVTLIWNDQYWTQRPSDQLRCESWESRLSRGCEDWGSEDFGSDLCGLVCQEAATAADSANWSPCPGSFFQPQSGQLSWDSSKLLHSEMQ